MTGITKQEEKIILELFASPAMSYKSLKAFNNFLKTEKNINITEGRLKSVLAQNRQYNQFRERRVGTSFRSYDSLTTQNYIWTMDFVQGMDCP